MAESPDAAVALSDEDLDELVQAAEGTTTATDDPEPDAPDPASFVAAEPDEDEETARPAVGDEDEIEATGTQPATAVLPSTIPEGAKPFQFKASGGIHSLPGAHELPDGSILIPKDSDLRTRLASQVELASNFKSLQRDTARKLAAAKTERTDKDIEADAAISLLADVAKMNPDERWNWAEQFDQERPKLELDIQRRMLERDRQMLEEQRNPTPSAEERTEQRTTALNAELNATYHRLMENPAMQALSPAEVATVFEKHAKRVERLVVKGDDGAEQFDDSDVVDDITQLLALKKQYAPPATATARNAVRNADTNPIPPVVATRAPTGTPKGKAPIAFKDRQKYKSAFMKGDLDDE